MKFMDHTVKILTFIQKTGDKGATLKELEEVFPYFGYFTMLWPSLDALTFAGLIHQRDRSKAKPMHYAFKSTQLGAVGYKGATVGSFDPKRVGPVRKGPPPPIIRKGPVRKI